jgi:protein phosphatase
MLSDRGRVRQENEDACFIASKRGLFLVSDGIGGQAGGAIASRLVAGMLPVLIEQQLGPDLGRGRDEAAVLDALRRAVAAASVEVRLRGAQQAALRGLGATVVLALLCERLAYVAHLGDSRAYLLRGGRLRCLTTDHTLANLLARIQPAQAAGQGSAAGWRPAPSSPLPAQSLPKASPPPPPSPQPPPHQLARYAGMGGEAVPDVQAVPLQPGDRVLLCSDGLTAALPDRLIAHLLRRQPDPEAACRVLVGAANEVGGPDNVSVVVVYVGDGPSYR